jgi:hypothetical protein
MRPVLGPLLQRVPRHGFVYHFKSTLRITVLIDHSRYHIAAFDVGIVRRLQGSTSSSPRCFTINEGTPFRMTASGQGTELIQRSHEIDLHGSLNRESRVERLGSGPMA